jgi:hypothetical protein
VQETAIRQEHDDDDDDDDDNNNNNSRAQSPASNGDPSRGHPETGKDTTTRAGSNGPVI